MKKSLVGVAMKSKELEARSERSSAIVAEPACVVMCREALPPRSIYALGGCK